MNFPKLYFLLLVDSIGFFNPSLPFRHVEAVSTARKYSCPRGVRNGSIKPLKSRGKVSCYFGFKLFGQRYVWCDGRHEGPLPVCIRPGCAPPSQPSHGMWMFSRNDALGTLQCDDGYVAGEHVHIFCDGHTWDSVGQRPTCTSVVNNPNTTCDFEDPGLCGWSQDFYHDFDWRRHNFSTPSGHLRTGPSFDHTFGQGFAGMYMYIEASSPRMENETARLYSPIYPANYSEDACFIFWYHMYGATMGSVNVYVLKKGEGLSGSPAVFVLSGNQGDTWRQAFVPLEPQSTQFQIVLEGVVGHGYEGDAAVDDVKLGHGVECLPPPKPAPTTPTASASAAYTEATVFEVSKEGADNSPFSFSPLVSSEPDMLLSTPDERQIIASVPSTSVKPPTVYKIKFQTPLTQTIHSGSSLPATSFDAVPPTEISTLKELNVSTMTQNVSTIGSEQSQNLTTESIRYTSAIFTDMQSSVRVTVSKSTNVTIASTPTQALTTRLYSDGAVFNKATDLKSTSHPTLAYIPINKTTFNYQTLRTTQTVPTSSPVTNATGKDMLVTRSSVVRTSVSPVTYSTKKTTTFKQFVTNKTASVPITTPRATYTIPRAYKTTLVRFIPKANTTPQRNQNISIKIIPKYLYVKSTTPAVKRFTSSYTSDRKTPMKVVIQTTTPVKIRAPTPAPSSRRQSAYQFLTSKLQQYMSPNQTPDRSKVESSGGSVGATLGIALAGSVAALGAALVLIRLARRRLRRKLQSRQPEDSDVRFLTSDEILDFNIARPHDWNL